MTSVLMRGEDTEERYAEMVAEIAVKFHNPRSIRDHQELEEARRIPEHFSNDQGINCSLA